MACFCICFATEYALVDLKIKIGSLLNSSLLWTFVSYNITLDDSYSGLLYSHYEVQTLQRVGHCTYFYHRGYSESYNFRSNSFQVTNKEEKQINKTCF